MEKEEIENRLEEIIRHYSQYRINEEYAKVQLYAMRLLSEMKGWIGERDPNEQEGIY